MSGKDIQDSVEALLECKAKGVCARDKIATQYLESRVQVYQRRMQTVNELYRKKTGLPPCPPDCEGEVIEGEVEVVTEVETDIECGGASHAGAGGAKRTAAKRTVKRAGGA
jgi:hypothetical protein